MKIIKALFKFLLKITVAKSPGTKKMIVLLTWRENTMPGLTGGVCFFGGVWGPSNPV